MIMKKYLLITLLFLFNISFVYSANFQNPNINLVKKLPEPNMSDPFLNMLSNRKSTREYNGEKQIDDNTLSDILWAGYGINRKDEDKRTIPTAMNKQDLEIYVIKKDGAYLYNAKNNTLTQITKKNLFEFFTRSQAFVENASVILLYTTKDYQEDVSAMHAGSAYQNVAIYCAEHNIGDVVKGSMETKQIARYLNIREKNILVAQVIGVKK